MNTEFIEQFRAQALTMSGTTYFGPQFTLGEGWTRLHGRIQLSLTIGTGSGAISEGELQIVKSIFFRTDKGEIPCNNVPLRLLHRLNQAKVGTAPVKDAIAASTATYNVPFDIWFSEPKRLSPEEAHATILDTSRYSQVYLNITMGGVSDLLTTPGTATVTATLDCYVERFRGRLPEELRPELYCTYGVFAPQNPNNQTYIDLEKSENLAYKRISAQATSGASAGVPMNGAADNTVINDLDVEATEKFAHQNVLADVLRRQNQVDYDLEAIPAGVHTVSWVDKSKSHDTALKSGGQSRLRVNWRNQATLPTNPQVTVGYEGVRPLAGVKV